MLMKWITKEGKDMFNLQANAIDISKGIQEEFDMDKSKIGISITKFNIESFNYPAAVKKMQEKVASQSMVGDRNRYTQMAMADSIGKGGNSSAGSTMAGMANSMAGMQMGMMMGQQMMNQMQGSMMNQGGMMNQNNMMNQDNMMNQQPQQNAGSTDGQAPKFCPNCGTATNGAKFCSNCGTKLV